MYMRRWLHNSLDIVDNVTFYFMSCTDTDTQLSCSAAGWKMK